MSRYKTIWTVVLIFCALCIALFLLSGNSRLSGQARSNRSDENDFPTRLARINQKAKAAQNNEEASVRELADEVFHNIKLPLTPPEVEDALKGKVVQAEMKYRNENGIGISEQNLVKTVNMLSDKLGTPEYSKTDLAQVRYLRVGLMPHLPHLIDKGKGKVKDKDSKAVRFSIDPEMSPLEAVYVTGILIQQKLYNNAFQVTLQEWHSNMDKRRKEKWEMYRNSKPDEGGDNKQSSESETYELKIAAPNPEQEEMQRSILRGAARLKADGLLQLANSALTTLGIQE